VALWLAALQLSLSSFRLLASEPLITNYRSKRFGSAFPRRLTVGSPPGSVGGGVGGGFGGGHGKLPCPQIGKDGHTGGRGGGLSGRIGPFTEGRLVVELAIINS
jgi:hypothetical protein